MRMRPIRRSVVMVIFLVFVLAVTLQSPGSSYATDPEVKPLKDLPAGTIVQFAQWDWILLEPEEGYVFMMDSLGEHPFDTNNNNEFHPSRTSNIGYLLNTTDSSGIFYNLLSSAERSVVQTRTWTLEYAAGEEGSYPDKAANVGLLSSSEYTYYLTEAKVLSKPDAYFFLRTPSGYTGCGCYVSQATPSSQWNLLPTTLSEAKYKIHIRPALSLHPNVLVSEGRVLATAKVDISPDSNSEWAVSHEAHVNIYHHLEITDLEYAWSTSMAKPDAGWTAFDAGDSIATPPGESGTFYLHVRGKSGGHDFEGSSGAFRIDNTAPTKPSISASSDWKSTDVRVEIGHGTDAHSGVKATLYRLGDDGPWIPTDGAFDIGIAGATKIRAKTVDHAGNESEIAEAVVKIDSKLPDIQVEMRQFASGQIYVDGTLSQEAVEVEVTADEENQPSGLGPLHISVNDADEVVDGYKHVLAFTEDGVYVLDIETTNGAGLTTKVQRTVKVDRTAPSVGFAPDGRDEAMQSVAVAVAPDDAHSGIDPSSLRYVWLPGDETPDADTEWADFDPQDPIRLSGVSGIWRLHIVAADTAGNETVARSEAYTLDVAPPNIDIAMKLSDDGSAYTDGAWVNKDVQVAIAAEDVGPAGLAELVIRVNDESPVMLVDDFAHNLVLADNGIYEISVRATDRAGNSSTLKRTVKISKSGLLLEPSLVYADDPLEAYVSGEWTSRSVTASVYAASRHGVTVTSVTYSLDGGVTWLPYMDEAKISFHEEGEHTMDFQAQDDAGNVMSYHADIRIDRSGPMFTIESHDFAKTVTSVLAKVKVEDSGSGVKADSLQYLWSQDGAITAEEGDWQPFKSGDSLQHQGADGEWYLHVRAKDNLGHEKADAAGPFLIKKPVASNSSNPGSDSGSGSSSGPGSGSGSVALERLQLSAGELTPAFSGEITEYFAQVGHEAERLTLILGIGGSSAKIEINGEALPADQEEAELRLNEGDNIFKIVVASAAGESKTYIIVVNRASADAAERELLPGQGDVESAFTDTSDHWAAGAIAQAYRLGLIAGYPDGTFRPNDRIGRAEFAMMLFRLLGLEEGAEGAAAFTDDDEIAGWARQAIAAIVDTGIISGYEDGSFRPGRAVTRAEMAVMLARALGFALEEKAVTGFADDAEIPAWARGAIAILHQLDILSGREAGAFAPHDPLTRAEAVVVLLALKAYQNSISEP